ncbi:MAG: ParA family protein [Acidimicrobiales bacterium]
METDSTGAVTLVDTPPPAESGTGDDVIEPTAVADVVGHKAGAQASPAGFKETISNVATAHAELDNVLPPSVDVPSPTPSSEADPTARADPAAPAPPIVPAPNEDREAPPAAPKRTVNERVSDTPVKPVVEHADRVTSSVSAAPATGAPPTPPLTTPVTSLQNDRLEDGTPRLVQPEVEGSEEPDREAQDASGNPLPRVLAVANQKGGVGKTTTSVNLGAALAEIGFRVLVIDLDPQGNATTGLGIDARNFELSMYDVLMREASLEDCVEPTSMKNLFVAPATIALAGAEIELVPAFSRELKLKKSIESVLDDFDYVLIDCPPSLGLITVNALAAADEVLVPIQCEYYAMEGLSQLMRNVHLVASNLNPKLDISTIVLTMYDARTKLSDQVAHEVRLHFGNKVCRNVIPRTVRLSEAPSFGQPITAFDPASRGAIAYRELAKEVSGGTS